MRCEIISVGTELLLGDIVNTNTQYLARRLSQEGIFVYYQTVVGDNYERLMDAYRLAFSRVDMVITTGGLGPTKDDITKEVAFDYFDMKSVCDEESLDRIKEHFRKTGRQMSPTNEKQAFFPKEADILTNNNGTAPGCIIKKDGKIVVTLPGPPKEMVPMFEESVVPYLREMADSMLISKVLRVIGVGESKAAELAGDLLDNENPTVAPYAKDSEMIFRITARCASEDEGERLIAPVEKRIRDILGNNVYAVGDMTIEDVIGDFLIKEKLTIATAESCTGGMVAAKLINYPGISESLIEGIVTYSNESKMKRIGVNKETLEKYGAVSKEVAAEMASGVAKTSGADIGISTTGVAGPGGGTKEKPVGLVYIGVSYKGKVTTKELRLAGNRQRIRERATMELLDLLRRIHINEKTGIPI